MTGDVDIRAASVATVSAFAFTVHVYLASPGSLLVLWKPVDPDDIPFGGVPLAYGAREWTRN